MLQFWMMLSGAFVASLLATGMMRSYALRQGLMDEPNDRSSHKVTTPRGGGAAFVAVFLIVSTVDCLWFAGPECNRALFTALLAGGTLIALIGFWDDHGHAPARWRFVTHLLAVLIMLIAVGVPGISLLGWEVESVWFLFPIYTLGLVWLINLFNFMDGIDGIASIEAVCVLGGCVLLLWFQGVTLQTLAWPMLLAVTVAGFLLWNWQPAGIFMGDVGSGFLGYVLGCFLVDTAVAGLIPVWSWLILLGVFVVDATVTLVRRFLKGERWYEAHRSHAYQHASRKWNSHRKVSLAVLGINLVWLLPLAWLATLLPEHGWLIMVIAMVPLVAAALWLGAGIGDKQLAKDPGSVI